MPAQGYIPQNQAYGVAAMQGRAMAARQPMQPQMGAKPPPHHSQSLDDGFSDFKAAGPATSSAMAISGASGSDDFGDFLQAPTKSGEFLYLKGKFSSGREGALASKFNYDFK